MQAKKGPPPNEFERRTNGGPLNADTAIGAESILFQPHFE
jgi:hypothetical protein